MSSTSSTDLDEFVRAEIARGPYRSPDELITAALKVYRELKKRHARLRRDVEDSIAEADRGEAKPLDVQRLIDRVTKRLAKQGIR